MSDSSTSMSLKDRVNADLKSAMIARDSERVLVLKSLKSAILYKEVEEGLRDTGLDDQATLAVLKKEKKSRADAHTLYTKANDATRANQEAYQIEVIDAYLPDALTEDQTRELVESAVSELGLEGGISMKDMGSIMGAVRAKNSAVEGGVVSKIIKEMA